MQADVKASTITATGSVVAARQRVKGLYLVAGASAGSVVLKDGGSGGTTKLNIATPASSSDVYVFVPGDGVLFETNVHATLSNVTSLTVFYG